MKSSIAVSLALSFVVGGDAVGQERVADNPYGMCVQVYAGRLFKTFPQQLKLIEPAGIGYLRVPMYFSFTRPDPEKWDFSRFDRVMRDLDGTGVRPICTLSHIWRPNPKESMPFAWPAEEHLDEWSQFAAKAAERYHDRVKHWEIWNEPNITGFWHSVTE